MADDQVLDKTYDPTTVEREMYALWESCAAFRSTPGDPATSRERTFTIVIPPPNVTGALHLGHALNNTLQDILVRYHRMRGFNTLWQPGTDHAGIATQAVVERRVLHEERKSRHDLGREALVERIWRWKDAYEKRIIGQLKLMGCSCDWSRTRFTLDEGLARAVREMFFRLFRDGLIFRGKRLVNWDTQLQTAVSDDEVYHETVKGHFWHVKYPVIDPKPGEPLHVEIATTRPETMLGDTAVAVHPDPEAFFDRQESLLQETANRLVGRSAKEAAEIQVKLEALAERRGTHLAALITLRDMAADGRRVRLPLVQRELPLIADEWADPTKGSGCVKITPAHDPNDYEVGLRHKLPMINVLTSDGKIARIIEPDGEVNPRSSEYEGLRFTGDGRDKVVADLEARGLLGEIEDRETEIGHSDRSKLPIEPFLSDQWFVKTGHASITLGDGSKAAGLAGVAMDAVTDGRISVFPSRYAKSYLDWLGEKRDWCISRQLWWGHRIRVWSYGLSDEGKSALFSGHEDMPEADAEALKLFKELPKCFPDRVAPHGFRDMPNFAGSSLPKRTAPARDGDPCGVVVTPEPIVVEAKLYLCFHDDRDELIPRVEDAGFEQDADVLDTWFSSALWPFSTLGWPEETAHLKQYYPGSVLCTSRDIITNWVARMVMFGLYAMGEVPFGRVYIHPKILDGRGETMSKSKGNGVDPVDVIHTHGADALRYSMADLCTETQDIRMPVDYLCPHCGRRTDQAAALKAETQARKSRGETLERKLQPADCTRVTCTDKPCGKEFATQWAPDDLKAKLDLGRETSEKFDIGRNFCNKLWNAARFAFMNIADAPCRELDVGGLPAEDRWILARLSQTIRRYHACLDDYRFSASVKELREFFWDSLCDWYLELTKPRLGSEAQAGLQAESSRSADARGACANASSSIADPRQILAFCLDQILRLWHPTIPFITERLWQQLNALAPKRGLPPAVVLKTGEPLILSEFPPVEGYPAFEDEGVLGVFSGIQAVVRGVRELRAQCGVSPKQRVTATVVLPEAQCEAFRRLAHIVRRMANVAELSVDPAATRPPNAGSVTLGAVRVFVHDISDDAAERQRTSKALADLERQIAGKEKKLANEKFVAHADPAVVEAERARLSDLTRQQETLTDHMAELNG